MSRAWPIALGLCFGSLVCACSVNAKKHPNYRESCDAAVEDRHGYFCIAKSAGRGGGGGHAGNTTAGDAAEPIEAGTDAMIADGATDAGLDATVPESCDSPDASEFCYPRDAPMSTALQPPCHPGTRICGPDKVWGVCMNEVVPMPDKCDGLDNDCDGKTDEQQSTTPCIVGGGVKGVCAENGVPVCRDGKQVCLQFNGPQSETCNGKDDDCDGKADEDLELACYGGSTGCTANSTGGYDCVPASTCAPGTMHCVDGEMQGECTNDIRPRTEVPTQQNGTPLDEDCDGMIDEGFTCTSGQTNPCYTGPASTRNKSPCKDGIVTCTAGQYGTCVGERLPQAESCANEGSDDDCDGTQDNIARRGTSCRNVSGGKGVCKANATWQCQAGTEVCLDGQSGTEVCDAQMKDEDCDGKVDEGFDLQTDGNNCGVCGNRCGNGLTCCAGSCVSTVTSNGNCGMCGTSCPAGLTCCSSSCVNTKTNGSNCGTCGKPCLLGCSNGACNLL